MSEYLSLHNDDHAWNRFVGIKVPDKSYNETQNSPIKESGNIYVFLAIFIKLHPNGAINVTNEATHKVLTSESFFISSYSQTHGGSIYVLQGSCIQYRVCSINSTISYRGEFNGCHSYVETTKENYIIDSSLSKSKGYNNCIYLKGGNQLIENTNISYANCYYDAAYDCINNPSSHKINFTSIINNKANAYCLMYHDSVNQSVDHCNVINNILGTNHVNWGIVMNYGCDLLNISSCVFSSNSGEALFYNGYGNVVVDKCYINDNPKIKQPPTDVSLNPANRFVIDLSHFSTEKCDALFYIKKDHKNTPYSYHIPFLFSFFIFNGTE